LKKSPPRVFWPINTAPIKDFFTHPRGFHAGWAGRKAGPISPKTGVSTPPRPGSGQKSRGAAMGESGSTDVLRTGAPKPPPAFPRSKKFLPSSPSTTLLSACFVPTPGIKRKAEGRLRRRNLIWFA
jgi:hypothetical protein